VNPQKSGRSLISWIPIERKWKRFLAEFNGCSKGEPRNLGVPFFICKKGLFGYDIKKYSSRQNRERSYSKRSVSLGKRKLIVMSSEFFGVQSWE